MLGTRERQSILRHAAVGVVATLLVGLFVALPAPSDETAHAADASNFDPGYIVSDENFYDRTALDFAGVQNFILSKNSSCAAGHTCLWNYRQNTPAMPASSYCQAMPGMGAEPASSIIARVGAACGISQKTLIVLLQKEQSLVSSTAPSQWAFDHATGFACPDTAPCDPSVAGFFYQVYYAARQFQVYRANPSSFRYKARAWNSILFHPNPACGSSQVYVANDATAGLYIYTPYQPNRAALANLYGVGDACSAYGNRNFWRLWSDWFGSPIAAPTTIGRLSGTNVTYLLGGGRRYRFETSEMLAQYSGFGAPVIMSQAELNAYSDAGPVQRAVRSTDGSVFLIEPNWRFRFTSCAQVTDFGMYCDTLPTVSASQLGKLADVGWLRNLVLLPDRSVWLMQGGQRRETPDPAVLAPYGISAQVSGLSNFSIGSNQIGPPVVGIGLFTDRRSNYRAVTGAGAFDFAPGAVASPLASRALGLHPFSYERLPAAAGVMPARIASDSRSFIFTDGGWLEVAASTYGGVARFASMSSGAWRGVPIVRTQFAPHFIRGRQSGDVFLASGGYLQPVSPEAQKSIVGRYGVESRVWVAVDGALTGIDRLFSQPYNLVRQAGASSVYLISGGQRHPFTSAEVLAEYAALGPIEEISPDKLAAYVESFPVQRAIRGSDGGTYLLDQGRRFRFSGCTQAADFGFSCEQLPIVLMSQLGAFPDAGALRSLVRLPDESIWFLQNGQRRETPDPGVLLRYGVPSATTQLGNPTLAPVPIGPPVLGVGVVTDGGSNYLAVGAGGNYLLSAPAVAGQLASNAKRLQVGSFALLPQAGTLQLRVSGDGRSFVAVDGGWLEVSAAAYGGGGLFSPVPSRAWSGVPIIRTQLSPHFVRERSASQVWLVSGGVISMVASQSAQNWIASTYGVENRVWQLADGALTGVPRAG